MTSPPPQVDGEARLAVANDQVEAMTARIAEQHGFRHHHHRRQIDGVCRPGQGGDIAALEVIPHARANR